MGFTGAETTRFQAEYCDDICGKAYLIVSLCQDAGPSVPILHIVDALDGRPLLEHFISISTHVCIILLHASTSLDVWRLAVFICSVRLHCIIILTFSSPNLRLAIATSFPYCI